MAQDKSKLKNVPAFDYKLNEFACGFAECVDNNWNYAIFAQDPSASVFQNEYNAGYVQGRLQGSFAIRCARNNSWKNFLIGYTPQDNVNVNLTDRMLSVAGEALLENYKWLYDWATKEASNPRVEKIQRLMIRMFGIYEGALQLPARTAVSFDDLALSRIPDDQKVLKKGVDPVTFLDVYFINTQYDLFDAAGDKIGVEMSVPITNDNGTHKVTDPNYTKPDHCTAYVKIMPDKPDGTPGDIFWTHNTWACFYVNSCAVSYVVGKDFVTQNALTQGMMCSNSDFGFNGHGICFNETTHVYFYDKPKTLGVWLTWRAAAAEMFATSIEDFYAYITLDNTGTFLNGYQLVDVNTREIGLIDMSYERFVLFRSDGKKLTITDSTGYKPTIKDYDFHLISPTHIFGINQPIDWQVNFELASMNTRPSRRVQLFNNLPTVQDMESAKSLITYTDERDPLSIYGRWDLGYGTTEWIRIRPDGSNDAKCFSADAVKKCLASLSFTPSIHGTKTSFWMKYGTPVYQGHAFTWSRSRWADLKQPESEDNIPDCVDGAWNLVKLFQE